MTNENLKKKWKTKSGLKAELYAYKEGQDYPYIGAFLRGGKWEALCWTENLTVLKQESHHYDLVEVMPCDDFKVDDKVLVSHNGEDWCRRYFAGVNCSSGVTCFLGGADSWSSQGGVKKVWDHCKKWECEE